jgi:uncharacterized protein (DUF58 family)
VIEDPGPAAPEPSTAQRALTAERLLQRLDLRVVKRLDGIFQGDFRTLFLGGGIDFADLRDYQPHDDVRHIDWNVTARMNSPFVREYVADRELTAWLLLDRSASMRFGGTAGGSKALAVTEFMTVIARLLTRSGNRVGAALFDHRVEHVIEPRTGRNQVLRLAHEMLRPAPMTTGTTTDLSIAFGSAAKSITRRSLVVVLSDFISTPGWERPLSLLARRHEVVCLRIVDPAERTLPAGGVQVFEDLETGEQLTVDTSDPAFRTRYAETVVARDEALHRTLARIGLDLVTVETTEDPVHALVRLSERRRKVVR